MYFMYSMINSSLFSGGRQKPSPSCNKLETSFGMWMLVAFKNQLFFGTSGKLGLQVKSVGSSSTKISFK